MRIINMGSSQQKNISLATIFIITILPIIRWLFIAPLGVRFFDFTSTMTSFGQVAGLLGMTLFSINLILSSRLKFFDDFFYGLNNVYIFHRIIGALSFSLLLFHPLFLAVRYIQVSLRSAALFFIPFQNNAITFGIIGLLLMIILMVFTFYLSLKYQNWKLSHKFMLLVFIFAFLHSFYIPSDISRDQMLRFYILGLGGLGLLAGFYRVFLSQYLSRKFEYRVIKVILINFNVVEIELEPKSRPIDFKPGQFIFIKFLGAGISSEIHPFSISSPPSESNLKLVIKSLGDFTRDLKNLQTGDLALIEGPFGKFSYQNISNKNQIWLAGGVGITPFLSMARSLANENYNIDLFYCVRNKEEAVLIDELTTLANSNKLKLIPWYSDGRGLINGQAVSDISGGLENKDILLCGPLPFMENLIKQILKLKVKRKNIHFEQFKLV